MLLNYVPSQACNVNVTEFADSRWGTIRWVMLVQIFLCVEEFAAAAAPIQPYSIVRIIHVAFVGAVAVNLEGTLAAVEAVIDSHFVHVGKDVWKIISK